MSTRPIFHLGHGLVGQIRVRPYGQGLAVPVTDTVHGLATEQDEMGNTLLGLELLQLRMHAWVEQGQYLCPGKVLKSSGHAVSR